MSEATSLKKFTSAVVGLGKVGSRFDEEKRGSVWSHAGAYLSLHNHFDLVGGADPVQENRNRFKNRCPGVHTSNDPFELVKATRPDFLSVCTPPAGRGELLESLLEVHQPKVLIVEKPIDTTEAGRTRLLKSVEKTGCKTLVNYNRRYYPACKAARTAAHDGSIGSLRSVTVRVPNRLWSMGSHAVNLLLFLADDTPAEWTGLPLPLFEEGGEPAVDMVCRFPDGSAGRVLCEGDRSILFFEVDIMGTEGRIRIDRNGDRSMIESFREQDGWAGYRVLSEPADLHINRSGFSSFVELMEDAYQASFSTTQIGDVKSAIEGENILEAMANLYNVEVAEK